MRSATHRMKTNGTQSDEELARAGIALGKQMNEPEVSQFGFELLEAIANGEDPQQRRARHVRRLNVYFCRNYPQTALNGANLSGGSKVLYRKAHRVLLLAEQHSDQILENLAGDLVETIVGRESMIEQLAAFERISNHDAQWWQSIRPGAEAHSGIKTSTPSLKVIKSSPRKKAALLLLGSVVSLVAAYALFLVFSLVSPRIDREKAENRANTLIKSSIKADDAPDSSISDHTATPQVTGIIHGQKPKTATPQEEAIKHNEQEDTQRGEDGTTMDRKEVRKALVNKTARIDREKAENRANTLIKSSIKAHDSSDNSISDHTSTPQVIVHDQKPETATPQDEAKKHKEQEDTQRGEDGTTMDGKEVRKALPVEVRKAIPAKFKGDFGPW
jgi:hypothetical protein